MTEIPSKVIITFGVLILTLAFITGMYMFGRTGQSMMNKGNSQQDKVNNYYNDSKLTQYDGGTITGSQIVKLINDNYDGLTTFRIETKSITYTLPNDTYKDKISCISVIRENVDETSVYDIAVIYDDDTGAVKTLDLKLST